MRENNVQQQRQQQQRFDAIPLCFSLPLFETDRWIDRFKSAASRSCVLPSVRGSFRAVPDYRAPFASEYRVKRFGFRYLKSFHRFGSATGSRAARMDGQLNVSGSG
uniref:Uncharacterized protein n=1 Tax=Anopheles coluzzii TaxID=1518534 RepID=A0A8W7PGR1_ANOCL